MRIEKLLRTELVLQRVRRSMLCCNCESLRNILPARGASLMYEASAKDPAKNHHNCVNATKQDVARERILLLSNRTAVIGWKILNATRKKEKNNETYLCNVLCTFKSSPLLHSYRHQKEEEEDVMVPQMVPEFIIEIRSLKMFSLWEENVSSFPRSRNYLKQKVGEFSSCCTNALLRVMRHNLALIFSTRCLSCV